MKKLLSVVLCVLMLAALLPLDLQTAVADTSGQCGDDLYWSYDGVTDTLTITGSGDMWNYDESYYTPWTDVRNNIDTVSLPDGLTSIGDSAFSECMFLTEVTIPDGVKSIGESAFYYCSSLENITIPNGVTSIGGYAFASSGLTEIVISDSVTSIGKSAFACTELTSVTIPRSVTYIGTTPFFACSVLLDIVVENGNPAYCSADGVLFNKDQTTLIQFPCGKSGAYSIPDSVINIDRDAFCFSSGLQSVTVPDSVTSIGESAFYGCTGITSVTIGNGSSIGDYAFYGCTGLTDVWYNGTEEQRQNIAIGYCNDPLLNATWHYLTFLFDTADVQFNGTTPYVIADGTAKTPRFTVKHWDGKVVDPANYDCEYKDNIEPGTASVIVTFKGEYSGTCSGTFEICSPTEIKTQPKAQTVANGKTAKFTVAALGKGVKYQWYYSTNNGAKWTKWSGKTSASVSVAASAKTNGNLYRCEITKGDYSSTSKSAKLTVSGVKPRITAQPKKTTVAVGETATFKVVAAGTGLKYQWYYSKDNGAKWVKWSGKTKASVNVTASAANNGTMYRCVVKNTKGSVTSSAVKMTVSGVKPRILTQPKAVTVKSGKTVKFTVASAGVGLKYQWQYSKNGGKTWTKLSGKTSATLSFKAAKKNNGWLYRCVVKNNIGSVNSKGVKLTVK